LFFLRIICAEKESKNLKDAEDDLKEKLETFDDMSVTDVIVSAKMKSLELGREVRTVFIALNST
jgi:hypothetical protein